MASNPSDVTAVLDAHQDIIRAQIRESFFFRLEKAIIYQEPFIHYLQILRSGQAYFNSLKKWNMLTTSFVSVRIFKKPTMLRTIKSLLSGSEIIATLVTAPHLLCYSPPKAFTYVTTSSRYLKNCEVINVTPLSTWLGRGEGAGAVAARTRLREAE